MSDEEKVTKLVNQGSDDLKELHIMYEQAPSNEDKDSDKDEE